MNAIRRSSRKTTEAQNPNAEEVEDPRFQGLEEEKLYEEEGTICELQTYERRYNTRGEPILLQSGWGDAIDLGEDDSTFAALVLTRFYSRERKLKRTQLEVKSPFIKKALREVIGSYPGVDFTTECPTMLMDEPRCLFHYRGELEHHAMEHKDRTTKEHVFFLVKYIKKVFKAELATVKAMHMTPGLAPSLAFQDLWIAFEPGTTMYAGSEALGGCHLYRLQSMVKLTNIVPDGPDSWFLEGSLILNDGIEFRWVRVQNAIQQYEGQKCLTDLSNFPLEFHRDKINIRRDLLVAGEKYISMFGMHHCTFNGTSLPAGERRRRTSGKIIVDAQEYYDNNVEQKEHDFSDDSAIIRRDSGGNLSIPKEEVVFCVQYVTGFFLETKQWALFELSGVELVKYNKEAFSHLVLEPHIKTRLTSIVRIQKPGVLHFDDMIAGKGKGTIVLLHGCPGVGKTFTAESIADYSERPLYCIGKADIAHDGAERSITEALARASRWNAIVLMDEADVFMQERGVTDMARNEQVSVLLRVLEYCQGIMFLTTNRVETIDPAFKSRIHLSIAFPGLSVKAKQEIWNTFILKGTEQQRPQWMTNKFLENISTEDVNGREIKNIVRVAHAIAASNNRSMEADDILQGLQSKKDFERDFKDAVGKKRMLDDKTETTRPNKQAKLSQTNSFIDDRDIPAITTAGRKSWLMRKLWPW